MRKNVLGTLLSRFKYKIYKDVSEFIFSKYADGTWIEQEPKWLYTVACYLWNSTHWDTKCSSGTRLPRVLIPIIKRVFPELIARELVSVQPMTSSTGYSFKMKYFYDPQREDESYEAYYERTNPVPRTYTSEWLSPEEVDWLNWKD